MGTGCNTCLKDTDIDEERFIIDKRSHKKNKNLDSSFILFSPHPFYPEYDTSSIIFLQSIIRGYIERKSLSIKIHGASHSRAESDTNSRSIIEIWGPIPDYSNSSTITTAKKLGRFKYQKKINDEVKVFKKGPVQIEGGAIYIGEWNDNWERHGKGIQTWKDGAKYEGYWKNDFANGKGRLIHSDGDSYEGDWVDGKASGKGIYIHADDTRYEGDWLNDEKHGNGIEIWANGSRYEGSYEYGKKHGKGKLFLADGMFEGDFFEGDIHGYGCYQWKDLRKYSGQWKNNKMDGQGSFVWPDGRFYKGEYQNDHKHGFGIFKWPNGKVYEGFWKNGKQHGLGKTTNSDGKIEEGEWIDGKMIQNKL